MEQQRIIENNILISRIFGEPEHFNDHKAGRIRLYFKPGHKTAHCRGYELRYHEEWNWFIPAYKKFWDDLAAHRKEKVPANSTCKGDVLELDVHCAVREFDLLGAFHALAECVKWYIEVSPSLLSPKTETEK